MLAKRLGNGLTANQTKILVALRKVRTFRQLAAYLGYRSTSVISTNLYTLAEGGYINYNSAPNGIKARTAILTDTGRKATENYAIYHRSDGQAVLCQVQWYEAPAAS